MSGTLWVLSMLTLCPCSPQADTSSLSGDNTLMSTLEEKETDGEQGPTASPAPADEPSSPLLSPGCTSTIPSITLSIPSLSSSHPLQHHWRSSPSIIIIVGGFLSTPAVTAVFTSPITTQRQPFYPRTLLQPGSLPLQIPASRRHWAQTQTRPRDSQAEAGSPSRRGEGGICPHDLFAGGHTGP